MARVAKGLKSGNIDHRLRQSDFSGDEVATGASWLGMPIADVQSLKGLLVVGSNLRKDHPLLAHRVRFAADHGGALYTVGAWQEDLLCKVAGQFALAPSQWATAAPRRATLKRSALCSTRISARSSPPT